MYSTLRLPLQYKGACAGLPGFSVGGETYFSYFLGGDEESRSNTMVYNTYYQWVPLYLIFMAFLFYLPRMFWLNIEGGLMKFLCKGTTTR